MLRKALAASSLFAAGVANAAPPDVSALVTEITGTLTPVATVAMAVLAVIVGTKVFKYIRRAL